MRLRRVACRRKDRAKEQTAEDKRETHHGRLVRGGVSVGGGRAGRRKDKDSLSALRRRNQALSGTTAWRGASGASDGPGDRSRPGLSLAPLAQTLHLLAKRSNEPERRSGMPAWC